MPAVLATGLILVVACSSESARPPQLGDCVPVGDAGCSAPDPGGGGGAGPPVVDSGGVLIADIQIPAQVVDEVLAAVGTVQ